MNFVAKATWDNLEWIPQLCFQVANFKEFPAPNSNHGKGRPAQLSRNVFKDHSIETVATGYNVVEKR